MFSFPEILLIFIVALFVLGPKQLISFAEKMGQWVKTWQNFLNQMKTDFEKESQLKKNEKRAEAADKRYAGKKSL